MSLNQKMFRVDKTRVNQFELDPKDTNKQDDI